MSSFSTYKLYKQGTSQVVTWLGRTAARFGYDLGSNSKGKKTTSNIHGGSSTGGSDNQVTKRIISVSQLPVLARVISEHSSDMSDSKTLQDVMKILKDVILKRKSWAKTFRLPDTSTATSNMRHMHFVNVLQDVYQILGGTMSALQPELDKGQASSKADAVREEKSTSMDSIALTNLFAVLDIEEPAEQTETIPRPARKPSPSMPARITYELEDEIDLEEVYFMVSCFFEDFQALRKHIAQSWADYKSGLLDLPAVAIATNVALEMSQRAETALLENIPKKYNLNGYEEIIDLMVKAVAIGRGVDPRVLHRRDDVINMDLQDISDFVCSPVYIIVSSFTTSVLERFGKNVPVMKKGFYGNIDFSGRRMTWRERFNQDKIVLLEFLPEFCIMKEMKMATPILDELSSGLIQMTRTRKIPIWLILGCQIYLDIHHGMLSDMDKPLKDLQTAGRYVSTTLQKYFDYSKDMSIETWSEERKKAVRLIKLEADLWINRDLYGAARKKVFERFNPPEASTKSHSILSRQPILCGVMLFRLNLKLNAAGVALVAAWGSLLSSVHLYNAVKRESTEEVFPEWQDVESIIQIQGKERIFVGDYPKDSEEYYKSFCLAFGYSASLFARNRRVLKYTPDNLRRALASSRGPRATIVTSTIADIFCGQYCGETRFEVTIHKLEDYFSTSSIGKKFGTGRKDMPLQFTSVSFLSALQAHIQSNTLALYIDYFALHIRCWDLLREIHRRLDAEFCKIGPGYLEKESQLPFLVGYLFIIATGKGILGRLRSKALREAGQDASAMMRCGVLTKAGELVKELVQKEGDREVERVRSVSNDCDWDYSEPNLEDLLRDVDPVRWNEYVDTLEPGDEDDDDDTLS